MTLTGLGRIVRLVVYVEWSDSPMINDIFTSTLREIYNEEGLNCFKIILTELDNAVIDD